MLWKCKTFKMKRDGKRGIEYRVTASNAEITDLSKAHSRESRINK